MIKNRNVQLIFLSSFCALALVAVLASIGLFEADYNEGFYVYFTNLSNYFCVGIMIAEFVYVIKKANKNEQGSINVAPKLKFIGMILILITFFVYNILLAKDRSVELNLSIRSVLLHVILPIMYVVDWFLFYDRGKVKWYEPLVTLIAPLIYVAYVFIRGWILGWKGANIYPYFFLDPTRVGVNGVLMWMGILLLVFLVVGYALFGIDKIKSKGKKE